MKNWIKTKAVFHDSSEVDELLDREPEEELDQLCINTDLIEAYNPSTGEDRTTVRMSGGGSYSVCITYNDIEKELYKGTFKK